jgi:hypothetical protein
MVSQAARPPCEQDDHLPEPVKLDETVRGRI